FASGVLLFAKTMRDRDALVRQFLAHTPVRQYLAVVRGHLNPREGTLVHYFRKEGMHQQLSTEADSKAARAELRYSVERSLRGAGTRRAHRQEDSDLRRRTLQLHQPALPTGKFHFRQSALRQIGARGLYPSRLHCAGGKARHRLSRKNSGTAFL